MGVSWASRRAGGFLLALTALAAWAGRPAHAHAQALPAPTSVRPGDAPRAGDVREAQLEARVRRLEAQVRDLSRRLGPPPAPRPGRPSAVPGPPEPLTRARSAEPALPLGAVFGSGFDFKAADDEFQLKINNLTQVDGRFFQQGGQDPVKDTFAIPRQWVFFSGRLTKSYEYLASVAQGFAGTNLLDTYLNFHPDDRFQVKIGRYFVPFTYEPYMLPVFALITPEFSLFFNNFEPNRDLGMMAWGQVARKRVDYAAGIFNGTKNGYLDTNDAKDVIGFLNLRPFFGSGLTALENLNVGGSVDFGKESSLPIPATLRTASSIPGNATIGVPFLTFNDTVREAGDRALWSFHAAYFHRQLSLIGEWDGGYQGYSGGSSPARTRLPLESFYVEAGYFLTGETVAGRGAVRPFRPFDLREGKFGLGALELAGRYNGLGLGGEVFTHGLADPNLWSNRVATVDLGFNWYLTHSVKVALFWEHAGFGRPVQYRPGALQLTSDLFLLRFQLRF